MDSGNALERHSLALHLRDVFARLPTNNEPLYTAWRTVLKVEGDDTALYEALRLIVGALRRLEVQINEARSMSDGSKKIAQSILKGMQQCVKITNLHQHSNAYSKFFTAEKLDKLTLISDHLSQEFPEPELQDNEIETIKTALRELDQLLAEMDLDPSLRRILEAHIILMRWALEQHATIGLDGIYDALARGHAAFHRAAHNVAHPEERKTWWTQAKTHFRQIFIAVDKVDRAYRIGKDAGEIASHLNEQGLLSFFDGS